MVDNSEYSIPDFSGDDFANDPDIIKSRNLKKRYEDMIRKCISIMKSSLFMELSSHKNLKTFLMYKNLEAIIKESFKSTNPSLPLYTCISEYYSYFHAARVSSAGTEDYLFGLLILKKNYPKTLICKETLREKISELVSRQEIDFPEQKRFSRMFYVLTENKEQLNKLLYSKPLNLLTKFSELEAEINGSLCLFRTSRKSISIPETVRFCDLAKVLNEVLN